MNWHRLFGLMLTDLFTDSPFTVELEKDLSVKRQFLDDVVLRKREGEFQGRLPDGLDQLATHNLITFKSHHEALDDWALKELTGHYVNYRKQIGSSAGDLSPESEFRLLGVCARFPQNLAKNVRLEEVAAGIYECQRGTDSVRVIVASQVTQDERNAIWHLFSARSEQVRYGAATYRMRSTDATTFLTRLFEGYSVEGLEMTYTVEDFRREYVREHLDELTPEELLARFSLKERLAGIVPDEVLNSLSEQEILQLLHQHKPSVGDEGQGSSDADKPE